MATMATTRCMKVMGDLRQLGNVNLRAAANSAISAHPHPHFGTRATMRALAALIGAVAHLAVSFQKVVPFQREGEADVAKRQFLFREREQPCTRMLASRLRVER